MLLLWYLLSTNQAAAFQRCRPRKFDNVESRQAKVGLQKKLADFMSDDRFLSADIIGRQNSAIVGSQISFKYAK